jgi:formylglycine-generating enzyme required for sulfatase activity
MELRSALTFAAWKTAGPRTKLEVAEKLVGVLGERYALLPGGGRLPGAPAIVHAPTQTRWRIVPGGSYTMGFSVPEEKAARNLEDPPPLSIEEMRPCHEVSVAPFLMMDLPLSGGVVRKHFSLAETRSRPSLSLGPPDDKMPVYLSRAEAEEVSKALGFAMPAESQWEYACRGGSSSLFFFGDKLPNSKRLAGLVAPEFSDLDLLEPNAFGLYGLFSGEWCSDLFSRSYDSPPVARDVYVVRSGASRFWPWQDAGEWAFCVSAMRMPSTDIGEPFAAVRLVHDLSAVLA